MSVLAERLHLRAESAPEAPALYLQQAGQPDVRISYRELVRESSRYARVCVQAELLPGEVVVLILQHGQDLVYAFWGAILQGAIPAIMPYLTEKLAPRQYRADLAALVSITRPAAIVTYPEFEGEVQAALAGASSVRHVITTDIAHRIADLGDAMAPASVSSTDDIALLQHSSGTTGLQKGVALSHRAVLNQLEAYGQALQFAPQDVVVSWLPLYHDMGLIAGFLMPILSGIPLVLGSPFDWVRAPHRLLRAVSDYKGTLSWLPNFAYNFCAQKIRDRDLQGVDLSSWRAVINCSEPVRWESHEAFYKRFKSLGLRRVALQTSYAMAENVFGVTQSELDRVPIVQELDRESFMKDRKARPAAPGFPSLKMMSSGAPLSNTQVRALDDQGRPVAEGHIGELALRSNCMLTGYYHRPDADAAVLRDGWYLTGDYGYLSQGEVFVTGRKKDVIIVGGRNIYPHDLEALSYEVAAVHAGRSVAFGLFNEASGTEDVVMIAEVDSGDAGEQERTAHLLRAHVTKNSAIALRHVHVVGPGWIVKTSSGKTARAANKEKFLKELGRNEK